MPTEKKQPKTHDDVIDALKRQIVKLEQRIDALEAGGEYEMIDPRAPITAGPQRVTLTRRVITK